MALDCNSCNNTLLNEKEKCIKHQHKDGSSYLVVDHGDEILLEMEEARLQLQKQIVSLLEKVCLLWDIVRTSLIFMLPVLTGMFASLLLSQILPTHLAPWASTLIFTLTFGLVFINIAPLNEAIATFLNHQMYVPDFKSRDWTGENNDTDSPCDMVTETLQHRRGSLAIDPLELD